MAKLFISSLIFLVSIQLVCYLFWAFNFFGGLVEYPLGNVDSLSNIFVLDTKTGILLIVGTSAIGIAAALLKVGSYMIYAMALFAIGSLFSVFQSFVLAIPNTIGALFPPETNPNPALFPINPFVVVIIFVFLFGAWWYIFGLIIQRDAT